MSGWFAMKRGITSHHIFKGKPERLAMWVWLLDNAAWADCEHDINGHTVVVPRGCVAASERRIASELGVGRQAVRTFIKRLEGEKMINTKLTHGRTMLTLCNWDKYQVSKPKPNPGVTHEQPIKEQGNNTSLRKTDKSAAKNVVDLTSQNAAVWAIGIAYLKPLIGDKAARSNIGRWLKTDEAPSVILAIEAARRSGTQDPIPYITQSLKPKHVRERDERRRIEDAWLRH